MPHAGAAQAQQAPPARGLACSRPKEHMQWRPAVSCCAEWVQGAQIKLPHFWGAARCKHQPRICRMVCALQCPHLLSRARAAKASSPLSLSRRSRSSSWGQGEIGECATRRRRRPSVGVMQSPSRWRMLRCFGLLHGCHADSHNQQVGAGNPSSLSCQDANTPRSRRPPPCSPP